MNRESELILEAYNGLKKAKVTDAKTATIIKEEVTTTSTTSAAAPAATTATPTTSGTPEVVKEDGEVASKTGSYVNFTGSIKTSDVYGKVKDATFEIDANGHVSWTTGIWLDGVWSGRLSFWNGGTWKGGTWKGGYWGGGTWEDGIHTGGIFAGGTWKNGTWDYGVFDGGTWEDGIWKDGDWSKDDTKWIKGRDAKGEEHTDAPFHWGGMKYSKVTDPSKSAIDKEKAFYGSGYKTGKSGIDTFDDGDDPKHVYGQGGLKTGSDRAAEPTGESCISEATKRKLGGFGILGKMVNSVKMIKVRPVISEEDEEEIAQVDEKKKAKVEEDPLTLAIAKYEALAAEFIEKQDEEAAAVNAQLADWLKELKSFKDVPAVPKEEKEVVPDVVPEVVPEVTT